MTDRELCTFLCSVGRMLRNEMSKDERYEFALHVQLGIGAVARYFGDGIANMVIDALSNRARAELHRAFETVLAPRHTKTDNTRLN